MVGCNPIKFQRITSTTGTMPVVAPVTPNMPSVEKCLFEFYNISIVVC